jgi:hypothetical protein
MTDCSTYKVIRAGIVSFNERGAPYHKYELEIEAADQAE